RNWNRDAGDIRNRDGLHSRVRHANRVSRRLHDRLGGRFRYRLRYPDGLGSNPPRREPEPEVSRGIMHLIDTSDRYPADIPRDFDFIVTVAPDSHMIPTTQLNWFAQFSNAFTTST